MKQKNKELDIRIYTILGLMVLVQFACSPKQQEPLKQDILMQETELRRYKKMAERICDCTKDLVGVYKKIELMSDDEKKNLKNEALIELDVESLKAEKCMIDVKVNEESNGFLKEDMSDAALKKYCPDFYNMLKIGRIN